jgi:hypothetical protein
MAEELGHVEAADELLPFLEDLTGTMLLPLSVPLTTQRSESAKEP